VLRQIGVLLDSTRAVADADQAKKMVDFGSVPSNGLMKGGRTAV
jgi:hypothetical protein